MDQSFADAIAGWSAFYEAVAGAAATLIGLVFVALSLNPEVMVRAGPSGVREWAGQTFSSFLALLVVALIFLIPDPSPRAIGIALLTVGCVGLVRSVGRLRRIRSDPEWQGRRAVVRFAAPATGEAIAIAVGIDVFRGEVDALTWLVAFVFLLVSSAVGSCWQLLKELGDHSSAASQSPSDPRSPNGDHERGGTIGR